MDDHRAWRAGVAAWALVLAAAGAGAEAPALPLREGWRQERIDFPPGFAPGLPYKGHLELRFPPGMFKPAAPDYFAYAFLWWVEGAPVFDERTLERDLVPYYQGLMAAVGKDKGLTVAKDATTATVTRVDSTRFTAEVKTVDAFNGGTPLDLRLEIAVRPHPTDAHTAVVMVAAPRTASAEVWTDLRTLVEEGVQHAAEPARPLVIDESKLPPVNRFAATDLDPARSACADFAGHVNAKWLAANAIPADRTTWGAFEMLAERSLGIQRQIAEQAAARAGVQGVEKIVGDLYATGLDETKINAQGIKPLASRLAAIDALKDGAAVSGYIRESFTKGEGFLFDFGPEADFQAPGMIMGYAMQGGLGLPDKSYYVDADKKEKLDAYLRHVAKVLVLSGLAAADADASAKQVVAMETRLARASKSSEEMSRDVSLYYNPVTPAEADKLTPGFAWTRFFASQGLPADQKFSLAIPAFHQEVSAMLQAAPVDHWKSYLRFHTVDTASPFLSDPFVQENFDFYSKTLRGQKEMRPRWKRALDTVNGQAGEALGQLYVKVAFPPESKVRMQELVKNLSAALKVRIEGLEWMSPETKKKAIEKWAAFTPKIGYPDKWRDWSGLRTSRDSYLENVRAAVAFNHSFGLSKMGKPVDRLEWSLRPQTVNANYHPLLNEITFPAAILQPPFFDAAADDALNYGGIGAVIGHEMIHGYDDQGSRFSASGKFEDWWSPEDAKGFAARGEKLVAQFDGYEVSPGKKVNGKLTLGENIADLGGLAVSYDAMTRATAGKADPKVSGMTRDQRFFANWATVWRRAYRPEEAAVRLVTDPHAPAMFRAAGTPSNMDAFAKAFGCKPGDAMVRGGDAKIVIW